MRSPVRSLIRSRKRSLMRSLMGERQCGTAPDLSTTCHLPGHEGGQAYESSGRSELMMSWLKVRYRRFMGLAFIILLLAVLGGCGPKGYLFGKIVAGDGKPLGNKQVTITVAGKTTLVITGPDGSFEVSRLPLGPSKVIAAFRDRETGKMYQTVVEVVRIGIQGTHMILQFADYTAGDEPDSDEEINPPASGEESQQSPGEGSGGEKEPPAGSDDGGAEGEGLPAGDGQGTSKADFTEVMTKGWQALLAGRWEEARLYLQEAADAAGSREEKAAVQIAFGWLEILAREDFSAALPYFRQARDNGREADAYAGLATALDGLQRYSEAAAALAKALQLSPHLRVEPLGLEKGDLEVALAALYLQAGDVSGARAALTSVTGSLSGSARQVRLVLEKALMLRD